MRLWLDGDTVTECRHCHDVRDWHGGEKKGMVDGYPARRGGHCHSFDSFLGWAPALLFDRDGSLLLRPGIARWQLCNMANSWVTMEVLGAKIHLSFPSTKIWLREVSLSMLILEYV